MKQLSVYLVFMLLLCGIASAQVAPSGDALLGSKKYEQYEKPDVCKSCHPDFYQQWRQSMMSQSYIHYWDEIEYFDLAVPHAEKVPGLKGPVDGCNGCHTPLAFMAGDVTPPRPSANSRANEGVSCEVCHTISSWSGDVPHNFSYISTPGRKKFGAKPGLVSPHHDTEQNALYEQTEFCGNCHNEKNPFGIWVKSTQIEWKEGPYAAQGVPCQQCHMPKAKGKNATMAKEDMVAQHLFHGAHDGGKVAGTIELRIHPSELEVPYDGTVVLSAQLFNAKTGHKFPSGSVEDRIVWLHVTATDAAGKIYHLPVDKKGFAGEEYTIASDVLAYQDMGVPKGIANFAGVQRDGVPVGDRIFRMPYLDPEGRMTIMQWNTKSLGVDYRIGPRETKTETYTWKLPDDVAAGPVTIIAQLNYQKLVKPVADFLGVPADESEIVPVNIAKTTFEIYE
ncbi:MAG TPA: multiheme c-type cytochrome [bacterium]|nr:multiheme c-type cytochrome [bacterium]